MMKLFLVVLLAVGVVGTALRIVMIHQQVRSLTITLQKLEEETLAQNEEWSKLLLEQATWGTYGRVEELARIQLKMDQPKLEAVVRIARQ